MTFESELGFMGLLGGLPLAPIPNTSYLCLRGGCYIRFRVRGSKILDEEAHDGPNLSKDRDLA